MSTFVFYLPYQVASTARVGQSIPQCLAAQAITVARVPRRLLLLSTLTLQSARWGTIALRVPWNPSSAQQGHSLTPQG